LTSADPSGTLSDATFRRPEREPMGNEVVLQLARAQEAIAWALVLIEFMTLMGLVLTAVGVYLARGTKQTVREVADMVKEMREDSKRMNFYLFSKLGPAETK
jgi:hypothetical protein